MDINIKSWGQIKEGNYDRIDISGGADITGDINFHTMTVRGAVRAKSLTGDQLSINGSLDMTGELKGDRVIMNGNTSVGAEIRMNQLELNGTLKARGSMHVNKMTVREYSELFLNSLEGGEIKIMPVKGLLKSLVYPKQFTQRHFIDSIECRKITASHLYCKYLKGEEIKLSHYCQLETVCCDGSLSYDRTCKIKRIEGSCTVHTDE